MSIRIEQNFEDEQICCANCGSQHSDAIIKTDTFHIGLCEYCLKQFLLQANTVLADLDKKCRFCTHYRKKPGHYDYGGECLLNKKTTYPKDYCHNFRFLTYETDAI